MHKSILVSCRRFCSHRIRFISILSKIQFSMDTPNVCGILGQSGPFRPYRGRLCSLPSSLLPPSSMPPLPLSSLPPPPFSSLPPPAAEGTTGAGRMFTWDQLDIDSTTFTKNQCMYVMLLMHCGMATSGERRKLLPNPSSIVIIAQVKYQYNY